jgi:acetoin utilization deacetylase AcuC-like enzyme
MALAFYTHPDMLDHQPGYGHPERPERLAAVTAALEESSLELDRRAATAIATEDLLRVHPPAYVEAIAAAAPDRGMVQLDPDTAMSPGSLHAARLAAGAVVEAVRAVARGEIERAFCAVRPPGHHAEPQRPMGFCLFSNVALAAKTAQAEGLQRVAVVDFDVHHGNGTQAVAEAGEDIFFASIHQWPFYPDTGEAGRNGSIVNATVPAHASRQSWRTAFESLMPALDDFAPDLVLVSAGFDAHARDPIAHQSLEAEDFAWATRAVVDVARRRARGRVVSSLEGGYDLEGLGRSAAAHAEALEEL